MHVLNSAPPLTLTWGLEHQGYCVAIVCCLHGDNVIIACTLEDLGQVVEAQACDAAEDTAADGDQHQLQFKPSCGATVGSCQAAD